MIARVLAAAVVAVAAVAARGLAPLPASSPIRIDIGRADIERAIDIGRGDMSARRAFNDAYTVPINDPPFVRLEVLTEFRRVVVGAELHRDDRSWGPDQAAEMLRPYRGTVTLVLHVRFSPLNFYHAMPVFHVVLYGHDAKGGVIQPRDSVQIPQYLPGQLAPPGSPVLGGLVEATFDARALDPRRVSIAGLRDTDRERRRVEIDFGAIE